jgi:hypothetical protein
MYAKKMTHGAADAQLNLRSGSPADAEPWGQILFDAFATIAAEQISKPNVKAAFNFSPLSESAKQKHQEKIARRGRHGRL